MTTLANQIIQETNQNTIPLSIFRKVSQTDRTAVEDCVDTYGNFIWALASKFTDSMEEAEAAAHEIFTDICQYSESTDETQSAEEVLIARIALRRLITCLR